MGDEIGTRNQINRAVTGPVIQADSIGQVTLHAPSAFTLSVPRQLPAALRDFTGRGKEFAALDALLPLAEQSGVSAVVTGTAGIGKTSVVVTWAHRVQNHFPDGCLFVNLRGFSPSEPLRPEWVLGGFLTALGVPADRIPHQLDAQVGLYRSVLAGRRVLMVLDNAASVDQVRMLLPSAAGCVALVTSRARLTGLVMSDSVMVVAVDLFTTGEARALVDSIIGASRAAAERDATEELIQVCGRLPLAVRIAATLLALSPDDLVADIVRDITSGQGGIETLTGLGDEHSTVPAVFNWSYVRLAPEQAATFRRLGLHPGTEISEPAAAILTGLGMVTVRRHLRALAEVHLVEPAGRHRYRMHDLLHAFAAHRAVDEDPAEDRTEALSRLVTWYARTALSADRLTFPGLHSVDVELGSGPDAAALHSRAGAVSWLTGELLNLLGALRMAAEYHFDAAAIGIAASMRFLTFGERTWWPRREEAEALGVEAARASGNRTAEGFLLCSRGDTLADLHRWDEVDAVCAEELEVGRDLDDPTRQCAALIGLGYAHRQQGRYELARTMFLQALPLARQSDGGRDEAVVECNLGMICVRTRQYEQALRHGERELVLRRQAGDQVGEAGALHNLAIAWHGSGDYRTALTWAERALAVARSLEGANSKPIARVLDTAADCLERLGDQPLALTYLQELVDLRTALGDPAVEASKARLSALQNRPR